MSTTNTALKLSDTQTKKLTIFEIVFVMVVSVALGVSFWGWTFFYEITKPFLKIYGLNYLTSGLWLLSGILVPNIIRKPGVALMASLISAGVEALFTHWGLMSILWGAVQGLAAELVFFVFMYRKWNVFILILASIFSCLASYTLDYFMYGYAQLALIIRLAQLSSFLLSSLFLAGILGEILSIRLLKAGVLNKFLIAKNYV